MKNLIYIISPAIALAACSEVPTGHRGVITNYGEIVSIESEGLAWYNPITHDSEMIDVRQKKWASETEVYTKDVQQANVSFALTYQLDPKSVKKVFGDVGSNWSEILVPQVVEQSIKDVFGSSEAVKDAINNRPLVQAQILKKVRVGLRRRNVLVTGFEINDIAFSKAFDKANEAKQVAVENAKAEQNKTVAVQERANQRVIAAKADAEAMKIKTAALTGNAKLVEYEAVQKWNGRLPVYMMGNSTPFINMKAN